MALSTCLALGYTYSESFCLEINVDQEEDKFTANTNWIIGAFFLGAIVGSGLVLLLTKPFLNAWQKKKVQDEEGILQATTDSNIIKGKQLPVGKENSDSKEQKVSFRASRFRRNVKKSELSKTKEQNPSAKVEVDPSQSRGMVDVLLQTTNNTAEVEMADQDMSAIVAMERSMEEEKEMMLLHILSMLMKIKMDEKQMTKAFYLNFVKKTGEDLDELNTIIEQEKEAAEEKLRNDPKLSKDSQTLESEMQKLQTDYNHKQAKLQRDFKDKIRLDLLRSSGMPEAEVENLMLQLMNEMAAVEEKLGLEQARQRRALEHRLARRRQAIEYKEAEEMETQSESDKRVLFFDDILSTHLKGASKLEGQRDEIIASFKSDLNEIQKFYSKESESMKLEKSDNLQNLRLTSFHKLTKKQEKEKALFLATADKKNSLRDFIKVSL
ncbi:trichohyalin-like [Plakobranchus ocellatus]|uniref:Trichohyalin-like n=1 Tax=Plakobranchus ocellatus TaxID=259542 RepID=A0AAV4D9R3_9GAST|nr:trichohyalin-like [Plakobranchus ocellatus]